MSDTKGNYVNTGNYAKRDRAIGKASPDSGTVPGRSGTPQKFGVPMPKGGSGSAGRVPSSNGRKSQTINTGLGKGGVQVAYSTAGTHGAPSKQPLQAPKNPSMGNPAAQAQYKTSGESKPQSGQSDAKTPNHHISSGKPAKMTFNQNDMSARKIKPRNKKLFGMA